MTALLQALRPKGRRRGPRQFIRVTLGAEPARRRKTVSTDELLGYDPADHRSFL